MGVYRTYFDKNNTIIKNSEVNTGRNQVAELYFGNNTSRFLFYCSFDEIKSKFEDKDILLPGTKHYLKIKNTSNFDVSPFLSDNKNLMFSDKYRSSSVDLELVPVTEFWDEGMGYDFEQSPYSRPEDRDFTEEPSNWYNRTTIHEFTHPGAIVSGTTAIATQHFDRGNEDILMDITDFVNNIITGDTSGSTYQGFCIKYTDGHEAFRFSDDRSYVMGLFTRHTQTFFEPFIETVFDDHIADDRVDFYQNKDNNLYLYVNVDGEFKNLDQLPTCTINNTMYTVHQKTKGIYYVTIFASGDTFDSYVEYNDIWSDLYVDGIRRPNVRMRFVPKEENGYYQMGQEIMEPVKYGISLSGIKREEKLTQGEMRKVFVNLRKPYTVSEIDVLTKVYYRLYIKQGVNQITILDWQKVNKTFNSNNFLIDTTWMIPQTYFIDLKVVRNGEVNLYNEELKFSIINTLKN